MKTYGQLNAILKRAAVAMATNELLEQIVSGCIRFSDKLNHDNLQARIDRAIERANEKQTPWFAGEYIMDTCREEIEGMAQGHAEDTLYLEAGERTATISSLEKVVEE